MEKVNRTFFEYVKRFYSPAKALPLVYVKGFVFYAVRAIKSVIHVLFLKEIIGVLDIGDKPQFEVLIKYYFIFIIFAEIVDFSTKKWGWLGFSELIQKQIDIMHIEKFVRLDNNKLESIGTGKVISIIKSGTRTWINLTNEIFNGGAQVLVVLIFTILMIAKVSVLFSLFFLFFYIFSHFFGYFLNKKMIYHRDMRINTGHEHTKYLVKIIMSKFEILQNSRGKKELNSLNAYTDICQESNLKMTPYIHVYFRLPLILVSFFRLFALAFLGTLLFEGNVDMSLIVGLSGAFILMDKAIDRSLDLFKNVTKDIGEVEKLWDLFDTTPEIKGYETGKDFEYKSGDIEINDLSYSYTKGKLVFKDFNLKIAGGKVTALVGNSGSGKSTLVKLISGYIRPNSGDVLIDNQSLKKTKLKSYYKEVGYLTQDPSVFDGTIYDNLTYAVDTNVEENKIKEIIELSKCEFIYDLQDGVNTQIGEKGIRLSGGQRQRLAIAKIMLKNPNIIILDEPTSALDSFSEEQISKAMQNLFKDRTVIIIAHRLQTVKHADDIILIESGEIKERGTHKELIKQKGIYKQMLDLQSGF